MLAASLTALSEHQNQLITGLQTIHAQLSQDDHPTAELLPTLTAYITQASTLQRKMMLIHARSKDLRRRAERLKQHRAAQDMQVAEWMMRERAREVPEARSEMSGGSLSSPVQRCRSVPPAAVLSASPVALSLSLSGGMADGDEHDGLHGPEGMPVLLGEDGSVEDVDRRLRGLGIQSNTVVELPLVTGGSSPGQPTPRIDAVIPTAASSPNPPVVAQMVTIKRKGKRRVRVPTIE
ncbi:hypothetical protein GGF37_006741 [Kickxella alabastrina]|nr:hypothetical protein GGF37_006741 [Kickxella alabastrina]